MHLSSNNYPQILAKHSDTLWRYFFDENPTTYLVPIYQTFPYNIKAFKEYEERFFELVISSESTLLQSATLFFTSLAQYSPEFYLEKTKPNGTIRMFVLTDFGCKTANDTFMATCLGNYNTVLAGIDKRSKVHFNSLYEQRRKIDSLFNYNNKMIPSYATLVLMFYANYCNAVIEGSLLDKDI